MSDVANQNAESPVLKEEKPKEETPKKINDDEIKAYLDELKKAGITSPTQVRGMANTAKEYGPVVNLLGEEREKRTQLERRLQELESRQSRQPSGQYDLSQYEGQPVDLEAVIGKVLERHETAKELKVRKQQETAMRAYESIIGDQDYDLVKDVWEAKMKDPAFVYQMNTGAIEPLRAYQETVRQFYKGSLTKSREIIEQLIGKPVVKPPHVEGAQVPPSREQAQAPVNEQLLNKIKDKANKGGVLSGDEELAALNAVFRR